MTKGIYEMCIINKLCSIEMKEKKLEYFKVEMPLDFWYVQ